jgi:hypothetical protein
MINCDTTYVGGPYGGVSVIAKVNKELCFQEIHCDSNIILPFNILNVHGK